MNRREFLKGLLLLPFISFQPGCKLLEVGEHRLKNLWGQSYFIPSDRDEYGNPTWHLEYLGDSHADVLADLQRVHEWMCRQTGLPARYFEANEQARAILEMGYKHLTYRQGFEKVEWK